MAASSSARGCTTSADALQLPFTCSLATGQPLADALPSRPAALVRSHSITWSDVAAGIMLNNGVLREGRAVGGRASLERELLLRSRRTWMPHAPGLDILLLASCRSEKPAGSSSRAANDNADQPAPNPRWFPAGDEAGVGLPRMHWRCFNGRDRLGVSLWRKTGALLTVLHRTFPSKRLFLKVDSDTMLLPHALLSFLRALHGATPRGTPLYFGSNRIASHRRFCHGRGCLLSTPRWHALAANLSSAGTHGGDAPRDGGGSSGYCQSSEASYAQGGAYGFDRRALGLLVRDGCLERAADLVRWHDRLRDGAEPQLFEDEAVGLCMRLRGVRLVTCGCFYDWGPCDINRPSSCSADTNASRLCHLPLTVHKLRQLSWFDGWWQLLAAREPHALSALQSWQRTHGRAHA